MRKNVFGRQFKRDKNQRKALFKGLLNALILNERIKTTEEKAKSIKGDADKLITTAKRNSERAYKLLEPRIAHDAIKKVIEDIAPRFSQRPGGYTRITKIGRRTKDNASMVMIEWTELGTKNMIKPEDVQIIEPTATVENTAEIAQPKKKEAKSKTTKSSTTKKTKTKKEEEAK